MVTSLYDLSLRGQRSKVEFSTLSNFKGLGVKLFVLNQQSKVFMVTSLYELSLRGQRSNKGQIFNFVRFQSLRCQIVRLEPRIKSFHGDLFVRPFLKGSKVKERSNFQLCPISKVKMSNCSS